MMTVVMMMVTARMVVIYKVDNNVLVKVVMLMMAMAILVLELSRAYEVQARVGFLIH